MIYIAVINNPDCLWGKLARWTTGAADYHIGFTDGEWFWEQSTLFRRVPWEGRFAPEHVTLLECPVRVYSAFLNRTVFSDVARFCDSPTTKSIYGYVDYFMFLFRWLGFKPRNYPGAVCSGRVRDLLYAYGWDALGSPTDPEPSPTEFRRVLSPALAVVL